ncbi:MAG: hypothetical protein QM535_16900 [Limnohabitans sp.]|nr:hypothetical protein [Limnohabitans sp.]
MSYKAQKKALLKIHLALLILLGTNFFCRMNFSISIHQKILFGLKLIFYITGLLLFFKTIKPFQKISIYFSLYLVSPILIFIGWLFDGIFGAILGSIFLFFFAPNESLQKVENITIYRKFGGLLGSCCDYEFTKNKMLIFERKVAELNLEKVNFDKTPMMLKNDTLYLNFVLKEYDENGNIFAKDSIVKLYVK